MTIDPIGWAASLRPGTIVAFRFPLGEGEGRAKTRPCLVIATTHDGGELLVTIAYGTSARSQSNRGLDLDLRAPDEWRAAGLHRGSRFVLMRRVSVRATDPGFDLRRSGTPVIGNLPASLMMTLRQLTRSLGASINEDRRRGSKGTRSTGQSGRTICWQRRGAGRSTPVVVEYRRRKRLSAPAGSAPAGGAPRVSASRRRQAS